MRTTALLLTVLLGACGARPPETAGRDVRQIGGPQDSVDLAAHRVTGKVTVFDFYADWCLPCKDLDRQLQDLMLSRPDLAVRRIDVGSFDSPVARQHLAEIEELPFVMVFSPEGQLVDAFSGLDEPRLRAALDAATAPATQGP